MTSKSSLRSGLASSKRMLSLESRVSALESVSSAGVPVVDAIEMAGVESSSGSGLMNVAATKRIKIRPPRATYKKRAHSRP